MVDDRLDVAIDTVAQDVLMRTIRSGDFSDEWGDVFPLIGQYDWERVEVRIEQIIQAMPKPDMETIDAAVEFLASRTTDEA